MKMKVRNNKYKTACMLLGYYDESNKYCETIYENLELKNLDNSITRHIYLNHDITMHVVPGVEIRVFAKNRKDIDTLYEIEGNLNHFNRTLDAFSKHNMAVNNKYIYTTFELEERRRALLES